MNKLVFCIIFFAFTAQASSPAAYCAERAYIAKGGLNFTGINVATLCSGVTSEEQGDAVIGCAKRAYSADGPVKFRQENVAVLCAGVRHTRDVEAVIECADEAYNGSWARGFDQVMTANLCHIKGPNCQNF